MLLYESSDYGPSLYDAFIRPFVNVLKTTKAAAEKAATKTQLVANTVTYTVLTTIVPLYKASYKEIFAADARRMERIQQKYADVFKHVDEVLTSVGGNYDGAGVFFLLFPKNVISYNLTRVATQVPAQTMVTLVDTALDSIDALSMNATGVVTDPLRRSLGINDGVIRRYKLIEDASKNPTDEHRLSKKIALKVVKILNSDRIDNTLRTSEKIRSLRDDALDALRASVDATVDPIRKLYDVDSLEELEELTGQNIDIDDEILETLDEKALSKLLDDVVTRVVNTGAHTYIARLERLKSNFKTLAKQYGVDDAETLDDAINIIDEALESIDR